MGKKNTRRRKGHLPRTGSSTVSARGAICDYCGKRTYVSRKYAKEANRRLYPNEKMSAYRCTAAPEWVDTERMWHIGHLAPAVIQGKATRAKVHGSAPLQRAGEAPRQPIPAALRAIVAGSTSNDKDNDDGWKGGPMPTMSEVANVSLRGFDRNKGKYREVTAKSPMQDRLALVHGALRAYALTHSFEEMEQKGHKGFVGGVNMSALIRELFSGDFDDEDKLKQLGKSIQNGGDRAGLISCLDASGRLQGNLPIWWVAADYAEVMGHQPFHAPEKKVYGVAPKKAPAAKAPAKKPAKKSGPARGRKRTRKPPQPTLDRMYRVKSVLEDVGARYDTALTYAEIQDELKARGVEVSVSQLETAIDLLMSERQVIRRQMSMEDKEAIRAAGGTAPGGIPKVLVALRRQADDQGNIPVLLGTLEQLKATEHTQAAPQEAPEPPLELERPSAEEAPAPETVTAPDGSQETLDERVERQTAETMRDMYIAANSRAERLAAENDRLRKAVDGLLATIEILKG